MNATVTIKKCSMNKIVYAPPVANGSYTVCFFTANLKGQAAAFPDNIQKCGTTAFFKVSSYHLPKSLLNKMSFNLEGHWEKDTNAKSQDGHIFIAEKASESLPETTSEIIKFFEKNCKGVGKVMATEIANAFGAKTLDICAHQPKKLEAIPKMTPVLLGNINSACLSALVRADVQALLKDSNVEVSVIDKIVEEYSDEATTILRCEPYKTVSLLGFSTADKIAMSLGEDADSVRRMHAATVEAQKRACARTGNMCAEQDAIKAQLQVLTPEVSSDVMDNPRTTIIKEPYSETVPEEYTAANITVSYKYSPKEGAKQYILDRFGITNDKSDDKDISDEELFDEQVAQLRELYHAREAEFDYNSDLVIDENYPENGATGTVVTSPAIRTLIQQFYATHSADSLFVAPSPVGGPWSGWKSRVNSPLGQIRNGVAHNGTDILVPSVQYSLIAPSQGIIVGIQDGYANGALQTSGQASRGNFVFVYYGEQGSVGGQKGVFVLYQHLTPGITWHVGDTIPAGAVIGRTGWSGYCVSSHGGTGEHLHLEQYIGFEQVDPESYLGN